MPNAEEVEARALEYGSLVSNIRDKKKELETVNASVVEATAKRDKLAEEITANTEANDRVRVELVAEEKRLADLKQAKVDELQTERTIVESQRRENEKRTGELNQVSDALDKRGIILVAKEKAVVEMQKNVDEDKAKLQRDSIALTDATKDLELREASLAIQRKDVEKQSGELDQKIALNRKLESDGKAALERARSEAKAASDDRLKEQSHLHEARQFAEQRQSAEKNIRLLLPVFYEVRDFIKNHLKNPDQVEQFVAQKFPEEAKLPASLKTNV